MAYRRHMSRSGVPWPRRGHAAGVRNACSPRRAWRPRRGPAAFTLVELLIVIAILALLISMVSPSLPRVRDMGRNALCLTNHRAIAHGLQNYHVDHQSFPVNYGHYHNPQRWALGEIAPYVPGGQPGVTDLRNRLQGQFPSAYVCPSADLTALYSWRGGDRYHACYWTNFGIRANLGWGRNKMFWRAKGAGSGYEDESELFEPGDDRSFYDGGRLHLVGGRGRLWTKYWCYGRPGHWHSLYLPRMVNVPVPAQTVFTGDTNDTWQIDSLGPDGKRHGLYHPNPPGEWFVQPGWWPVQGSLGFDRHNDKLLMGYLDGSARPSTRQHLYETSTLNDNRQGYELNGDFIVQFPASYACGTGERFGQHSRAAPVIKD